MVPCWPSCCLKQADCCVASCCAALSSSRCAALLSSCCPLTVPPYCCLISSAGCCDPSLHCPLVVLSLCCSLVILHWLVNVLPLVMLPSHPLVMPPYNPLVVLSLPFPLAILSRRLVVVSPLIAPPSPHPLTAPPSHCLAQAGCCVASCCATLLSSCHASLSSSWHPLTAPPSCCLISPAGSWIASHCTTLSLSSYSAPLLFFCTG